MNSLCPIFVQVVGQARAGHPWQRLLLRHDMLPCWTKHLCKVILGPAQENT